MNWPHTAHNSSREIPRYILLLSFLKILFYFKFFITPLIFIFITYYLPAPKDPILFYFILFFFTDQSVFIDETQIWKHHGKWSARWNVRQVQLSKLSFQKKSQWIYANSMQSLVF